MRRFPPLAHIRKESATTIGELMKTLFNDEIAVTASTNPRHDNLSLEIYSSEDVRGFDITLSRDEARELAQALIAAADEVDSLVEADR